jgi:hypothetical protein
MGKVRTVALAVLLVLPLVGLASPPAAAAGWGCTNAGDGNICVNVEAGPDTVYGRLGLVLAADLVSATIYVKQCHTDHTHCVTIAANNKPQSSKSIVTSRKPAPLGHAFQTCGSWTTSFGDTYYNVCSEWRTNP